MYEICSGFWKFLFQNLILFFNLPSFLLEAFNVVILLFLLDFFLPYDLDQIFFLFSEVLILDPIHGL